jgi:hypothetical protein
MEFRSDHHFGQIAVLYINVQLGGNYGLSGELLNAFETFGVGFKRL